jgi:hypothetical protein
MFVGIKKLPEKKGIESCDRKEEKMMSSAEPLQSKLGGTEREGFEPPLALRLELISSQSPSAGLGHLSHKAF